MPSRPVILWCASVLPIKLPGVYLPWSTPGPLDRNSSPLSPLTTTIATLREAPSLRCREL